MTDVPVLIVGGGPAGLTASILLSRLGVRSLLVERHTGTSRHPKARAINPRTMEVFRHCGVEDGVRAAGLPPDRARWLVWATSLVGEELERRVFLGAQPGAVDLGPSRACICAQDDLEPVLRSVAQSLGPGTVRFATEMVGLEPEDDGVTVHLRHDASEARVRAQYLIAADGARSPVREALGIATDGTPAIYRSVNVLMRADLTRWVADRPAALYFIEQPALKATFLTINGTNRWGFLINDLPVDGPGESYDAQRCIEIVRTAAGVPDLPVEILGIDPWTAAAQVARQMRQGRVFLAGDAAHHMPPTGGFGLNTGVQDVHNLAWKLAAVVHGWAAPALLDSYEAERLPYGRAITEQSVINLRSMGRGRPVTGAPAPADGSRARPEYLSELGMIFGASYDSSAVMADGTPPPPVANPISDYAPVARPGSRAPHLWLERDGQRISTLDLADGGFTLLTTPAGASWCDAAPVVSRALGVPVRALRIGPDGDYQDRQGTWSAAYGLEAGGAVMLRPDGHVAWRSRSAGDGAAAALEEALRAITGRAVAAASSR